MRGGYDLVLVSFWEDPETNTLPGISPWIPLGQAQHCLTMSSGGNINSWVGSSGRNSSSEKSFVLVLKRESTEVIAIRWLYFKSFSEWDQKKIDIERTKKKRATGQPQALGSKSQALTQTWSLATHCRYQWACKALNGLSILSGSWESRGGRVGSSPRYSWEQECFPGQPPFPSLLPPSVLTFPWHLRFALVLEKRLAKHFFKTKKH